MANLLQYTTLITSEHNGRPNFMALLQALVQPSIDSQNLCNTFPSLFDIEVAVGDQLDIIGRWVGVSRNLSVPVTGVFFSWGIVGLGWGQGNWTSPFDTSAGMIVLADGDYRTLLLATIASNQWDGTIPGAYDIMQLLFELTGVQMIIQDNQDMSMSVIVLSHTTSAVFISLLKSGLLIMRPAGVNIVGYFQATAPIFGWGPTSNIIQGWGTGNWITIQPL
jgi:hypothetical protein